MMKSDETIGNRKLLGSWKEIGKFLGQDPKTCQRWEKQFGVPIHRKTGAKRSRVHAYPDELENWRKMSSVTLPTALIPPGEAPIRVSKTRFSVKAGALLLLPLIFVGSYFMIIGSTRGCQPVDFSIVDNKLIAIGSNHRRLWPFDPHLSELQDESFYRKHFQKKKDLEESLISLRGNPLLIIRDINHDGWNEILFAPQTTDLMNVGKVYLIDHNGNQIWNIDLGQEIYVGSKAFSSDYVIAALDVRDFLARGNDQILIIGHSRQQDPARILLVDLEKNTLGEYWNYGQISDILIDDLDYDRIPELILGGQNGEYGKPVMIVLDPRNLSGSSPQGPDFQIKGKGHGTELNYILFPLSPIDILRSPGNAIIRLDVLKNGHIQAMTNYSFVIYEFDNRMRPLPVTLTYSYEFETKAALTKGELKAFETKIAEQNYLFDNLRFWIRSKWSGPADLVSPVTRSGN
jgi:hypothetical protein